MATEFRQICFSSEEMTNALRLGTRPGGEKLPNGVVTVVSSIRRDGAFFYEFGLFDFQKKKEHTVLVPEDEVLEMAIQQCIRASIPLPKPGDKSVRQLASGLALEVRIG